MSTTTEIDSYRLQFLINRTSLKHVFVVLL